MILVYCLLLTLAGSFFLPWWWVSLACFIVGFWRLRPAYRTLSEGAMGAGAAWFLPALWLDHGNHSLLSGRIAELFSIPGPLPPAFTMLAATTLFASMLGGSAALAGNRLRKAWVKQRQSTFFA